jgi:hypothetical protein
MSELAILGGPKPVRIPILPGPSGTNVTSMPSLRWSNPGAGVDTPTPAPGQLNWPAGSANCRAAVPLS